MRCDELKENIVDLVYDENNKQNANNEMQEHLRTCPACRREVEELKQTRKYLQNWKDERPLRTLSTVEPIEHAQRSFGWRRVRFAAIAAMVVIGILALANTQITWNKEGFSFRTSIYPKPVAQRDYYTKTELRSLLKEALDDSEFRMNETNFLMIQEALDTVEQSRWMDLRLNRSSIVQRQGN